MFNHKVVLIDDQQDHLNFAHRGLSSSGFPAFPILYNKENGVGIRDHMPSPASGIRFIFTDVNLDDRPGTPSANELAEPIALMLRDLISNDNGPYALILWTRHPHLCTEIRNRLADRHDDIPAPLVMTTLSKFEIPGWEDEAPSQSQIDNFKEKLQEILEGTQELNLFLEWEKLCSKASSKVTSSLVSTVGIHADWNKDTETSKISSLAFRIAEEAVGRKNIQGKEHSAFISGMTPILEDTLHKENTDEFNEAARSTISNKERTSAAIESSLLNTAYHIDFQSPQSNERGAFVEISKTNIDDQRFSDVFNHTWSNIFSDFYDSYGYKSYSDKAKAAKEPVIKIRQIRQESIPGMIEVSPSCDAAQNKNRNHRYILACLIPSEYECIIGQNGGHAGIHCFPKIRIGDREYSLRANFRFVVGLNEKNSLLDGETLFRLRDQIMTEFSFNFGKHASRPGIIRFS